jgi:hypothetical protein
MNPIQSALAAITFAPAVTFENLTMGLKPVVDELENVVATLEQEVGERGKWPLSKT